MARALGVFVNIGAKVNASLNTAAGAVERRFGLMGRRLRVQAAETKIAYREMAGAIKPLAAMAAAGGLTAGLKGIMGEGGEYAHQLSMLKVAGRTSKEVAGAIASANRTMLAVPTSTLNDNLKVLNETTLAYGNFGHAMENLTFNQKMGGMLQNMLGDKAGDPGEMFNSLIRGMEIRGSALDPKRYQREASQLYKAMVATGGVVNPGEILGFTQNANPAVRGYSERFFTKIVPSLIQEFGGERAGTALTAFNNQILGRVGVGGKTITQEWQRLGLVPMQGSGGNLSKSGWTPGSMKGTDLARTDPLAFAEKVLLPAMAKAGININDSKAVGLEAKKLFGRETGARLAGTLLDPTQRQRLHKDERLFNQAKGSGAAYALSQKEDPKMAWAATSAALKNFETVLGKAVAPALTRGLNMVAGGLQALTSFFDRHPNFGKGVTALMGFGAVTATLKVFGVGLRWAFSPLRSIGRLLAPVGGMLWRALGPMAFRGLLAIGTRIAALGPLILRAFAMLAPVVGEGVVAAFGLLSNPVGWAILAGAAVVGAGVLVYHFREAIGGALGRAWGAIKSTFLSVPWGSIGMAIADAMTFGLASKLPALGAWWRSNAPTALGGAALPAPARVPAAAARPPAAARGAPAARVRTPAAAAAKPPARRAQRFQPGMRLAGARARGGPVMTGKRYLVGERGPEIFEAPRNGTIIPNGETRRAQVVVPHSEVVQWRAERSATSISVGQIVVQGASDPEATARAVRRELKRMADRSGYLSD